MASAKVSYWGTRDLADIRLQDRADEPETAVGFPLADRPGDLRRAYHPLDPTDRACTEPAQP